MEFTNDEISQILESNEFDGWEESLKRLIDYIIEVMDENVPENEKDVISEDIIVNLFIASLNLQNGIKK